MYLKGGILQSNTIKPQFNSPNSIYYLPHMNVTGSEKTGH